MAPGITRRVKARLITFLNRHGYRYGKEKHSEDEFKVWFNKKEIYSDVSNHINMLFKSICYLKTFLAFMRQNRYSAITNVELQQLFFKDIKTNLQLWINLLCLSVTANVTAILIQSLQPQPTHHHSIHPSMVWMMWLFLFMGAPWQQSGLIPKRTNAFIYNCANGKMSSHSDPLGKYCKHLFWEDFVLFAPVQHSIL